MLKRGQGAKYEQENSQSIRQTWHYGTMKRKILTVVLFFKLAILIGIPESFARPQYFASLVEGYGGGSCGTCHVSASGGEPRNSYGTLFENQL